MSCLVILCFIFVRGSFKPKEPHWRETSFCSPQQTSSRSCLSYPTDYHPQISEPLVFSIQCTKYEISCVFYCCFCCAIPQLPRDKPPLFTDIPRLGVISSHQEENRFCHNNDQHQEETACPTSQHVTSRLTSDAGDGGVHVYVHSEDSLSSKGEEESEAEVKPCSKLIVFISHTAWSILLHTIFLAHYRHDRSTQMYIKYKSFRDAIMA